jgi:hypothetical protein
MRTNIFKTAVALSDSDLLDRTRSFAADEREATAELVAHLAALEMRPSAYAALGHGSLYGYCTEALHLSEDAACTRIAAARWCREFPVIPDLMAAGVVSLTAVRLLGPHLTPENHSYKRRTEIRELVAALAPRPDAPASVRRLPSARTAQATPTALASDDSAHPVLAWDASAGAMTSATACGMAAATGDAAPSLVDPAFDGALAPVDSSGPTFTGAARPSSTPGTAGGPGCVVPPAPRPVIQPTAPDRYRVQCTIGRQGYDELRRVQALLRREIPGGDPGLIFERALHLLLEQVETAKLGTRSVRARKVIRSGTDEVKAQVEVRREGQDDAPTRTTGNPKPRSRRIPSTVRAAVWERDGARCAFVSRSGHRCTERTFLEFHHLQPYAREGPGTVDNIALRCRRHNQYEGELEFGPRSGQDAAAAGS